MKTTFGILNAVDISPACHLSLCLLVEIIFIPPKLTKWQLNLFNDLHFHH